MPIYDNYLKQQQDLQRQQENQNTGIGGDVVDLIQKGAIDAVGGVASFVGADSTAKSLQDWSAEQLDTLSPEMKQSMAKRFVNDDLSLGEGVKDWRSWVGQGAVLAGQMLPTLGAGAGASVGARAIGAGTKLAGLAGGATNAAANAAIAGGLQGQQVEDEINNLPWEDLKESEKFRTTASQYAQQGLPASEVLARAKQDLAKDAAETVMRDPTLLGVNALGGLVGDKAMGKLVAGKLGQTIRGNVGKGIVAEGGSEAFQGGFGQYVSNVAQQLQGLDVDPMEGVYAAALEEGLIAGGLGGAGGSVGGAVQRLQRKMNAREQIEPIIDGAADELAATGYDRETAVLEIQRMAEEAAIKMGLPADEAAEVAQESTAATTGQGQKVVDQVARLNERAGIDIDAIRQQQAERQSQSGSRSLTELAYDTGGRTGRIQQAAQEARADNVPYVEPEPLTRESAMAQMEEQSSQMAEQGRAERRAARDDALSQMERESREANQENAERRAARVRADLTIDQMAQGAEAVMRRQDTEQAQAERDIAFDQQQQLSPEQEYQQRVQGLQADVGQDQRQRQLAAQESQQRQAGFEQAEAEQAAWDETGESATIKAVTDQTGQPQTTVYEQDTVAPQRQRTEGPRFEELSPQQQVDQFRGQQAGVLQRPDTTKGSKRLQKKKTAKMNRQMNAIYERIAQANPTEQPTEQAFGYRPNSAMADAFAALQPTQEAPTKEQFDGRVDQLQDDGVITPAQAEELKASVEVPRSKQPRRTVKPPREPVPRSRQPRRTTDSDIEADLGPDYQDDYGLAEPERAPVKRSKQPRRTTDTGVPIDEVAGDYQSVSSVADQTPTGAPFFLDVFEGATYDPTPRLDDKEWQTAGGWTMVAATQDPKSFKPRSKDSEHVVTPERGGSAYSVWRRQKKSTVMNDRQVYDWDGDEVRWNDEQGRVQIRKPADQQFGEEGWSTLRRKSFDLFTEETGIEIPEEYRKAAASKRRDAGKKVKTEVVEPTAEQAQAVADSKERQAKSEGQAKPDRSKYKEKYLIQDTRGNPFNGIDKALAAMKRYDVSDTHYPEKQSAGPARTAKYNLVKLPEKVEHEGDIFVHGWTDGSESGFFFEGLDAAYALEPFALQAGEGRRTSRQTAPSSIDWKDIKGNGLKTVNSVDLLRKAMERGATFDTDDAGVREMIQQAESQIEKPAGGDTDIQTEKTRLLQLASGEIVRRQSKTDLSSGSEQTKLQTIVKALQGIDNPTKSQLDNFQKRIDNVLKPTKKQVKPLKDKLAGIEGAPDKLKVEIDNLEGTINEDLYNRLDRDLDQASTPDVEAKINAEVEAKMQEVEKTSKLAELDRKYRRLRSGQIKPDQVVSGASISDQPRKTAFEWLYREMNNADPSKQKVSEVGIGSNAKPFKSEVGARNQGKGKGASKVIPASDIMSDEEGFVWVKFVDGGPDGDGGNDPTLTSETPTPSQTTGKVKTEASMRKDIVSQLYVPGLQPENAGMVVSKFFNTMGFTNYMAELPAYKGRRDGGVEAWKAQKRQLDNLKANQEQMVQELSDKAAQELAKEENIDVPSTVGDLERDTSPDAVDRELSEAERQRQARRVDRQVDDAVEQGRTTGRGSRSLPETSALDTGTQGDNTVDQRDGEPRPEIGVTGDSDTRGSDPLPDGGLSVVDDGNVKRISDSTSGGTSATALKPAERKKLQAAADKVAVSFNNAKNIDETLPLLSPEQRTDVVAAEKRLYGDKKKGMMFTNGTGTGKTYTGCGVIKRAIQSGKKVLVVAKAGNIKDWQGAAKDLAFTLDKLKDKSTGAGESQAVITSYQNFQDNQALLEDKFDLVVYDESHQLMGNMQGAATKATAAHQALTGTKDRGYMRFAKEFTAVREEITAHIEKENKKGNQITEAEAYKLPKFEKKMRSLRAKAEKFSKKYATLEKKNPTKVVFLSATPFSGHKSVFYADGYLFDTNEGHKESGAYNAPDAQQQFLVSNFGYRMRYGKANQPGVEVDIGMLERDWADQMFESGSMVGRTLNLSQDYSREFPQVDQGEGKKVDELAQYLSENYANYPKLNESFIAWRKNGKDRQLAEALRVQGSIPRIEKHLELGRKVVVFHQRMEMSITHPFSGTNIDAEGKKELDKLRAERPDLLDIQFGGLFDAPTQLLQAFGSERIALFNGQVTKTRNEDLKEFNKDGGTKDILVIQKDAGKEGLSAHDKTGSQQRAIIMTNQPQSPADAIQMEGRIYRFGLATNAVMEYPTIQTNFEKVAFRDVVSTRTATAENLAMGSNARHLRESFRNGYLEPTQTDPNLDQGTGGKEGDRSMNETTRLDRAKTYYYKRQQKTQRTKSAEGEDYFATPEPIGMKMVDFANLMPGETALEPSAGHGAIAHWFPESVTATAIEPSPELIGDLSMFTDADVRQIKFEELNIVNKYDGITMNPPFGHGGHLAIQHIDKAFKHLNDGGRVVAIYPEGSLADGRFDKWYENTDGAHLVGEIRLPGVTFKRAGTGVKTRILIIDKDRSGKSVHQSTLKVDYNHISDANKLFESLNDLDVPARPDISIEPREVGISYKDEEGEFVAELNRYGGKARELGIRDVDKIAERYYGEKHVETDYFGDKEYSYSFDTERDRKRFTKAIAAEWDKQYRRTREKNSVTEFKDDDSIRFSKLTSDAPTANIGVPAANLSQTEAQSLVRDFIKEYNGNVPITFRVQDNILRSYPTLGKDYADTKGVYLPKSKRIEVYFDAALRDVHASTSRDLRRTLRHELLGHFGLNTFKPKDKRALLDKILATRNNPKFADLWRSVDKAYGSQPLDIRAEEVFAMAAEVEQGKLGKAWTSIVDTFQRLLQKVGLSDGNLTRQQLQATINRIEKGLKDGTIAQNTFPQADSAQFRKQTPEDIETITSDFLDQYKGLSDVNVMVLPNQAALAEITNVEANATVKGAYMPASDTLVLVADNIDSAEDARRVLRHELIAHKGLMQSLSPSDINLLTKQVMGLQKSKPLADIWKTVNSSYHNSPDAIKAEEVIARIAEQPRGKIGQVADQVISWVMGALRRTGLLSRDKVTLAEVRNMLNNVDKDLRTGSGKLRNKRTGVLFSQEAVNNIPEPKYSVEDALRNQRQNVPYNVKRILGKAAGAADKIGVQKLRESWRGLLTLRQIVDQSDKLFGGKLSKYLDTVNEMRVVQNQLVEEVSGIVDDMAKWQRKNKAASDALYTVMHNATLANVDPSEKFESMVETLNKEKLDIDNRVNAIIGTSGSANKRRSELMNRKKEITQEIKSEPRRMQEHKRLKREFDKLTPEAQQRFKKMRDHYIKQRGRMQQTLMDQIDQAAIDGSAKAVMLRQLRFDMERAKKGLYFPLSRFGNYWIDTADKDGERRFMMYESEREMKADVEKLKAAGYTEGENLHFGQKLEEAQALTGASLGFTADVIDSIKSSNMNKLTKDSLTDTVYQLYLQSMPERSIRRNFIHRKGVAGYSEDAVRAMADQGIKQSRQQARLQFVDNLEEQMVGIREDAGRGQNIEKARVANEMAQRHEWVKNPQRSSWAQQATQAGFVWLLGVSPAAALVNLTQNLQVAVPVIGSKHGFTKTLAEMGNVSSLIIRSVAASQKDGGRKGFAYYGTSGHERDAIQYGIDVGALDTTQAADLMGFAENPTAKYNGLKNRAMNIIGWSFHKAEVFNREAAFLTAYRLEYAKNGGNAKAAQDYAVNATYESHFDYNTLNRARFMQSDLAAVALQFKQYSQSMTYFLWNNLIKSAGFRNATKEEQSIARKQLIGTLAVTMGIGGLGALPLWLLTAPMNAANSAFGDEDEPFDAETEVKRWLSDNLGAEAAQWLYYGSVPSISGRISLNDLWLRDPGMGLEPDALYKEYAKQFAGPVFGGIGMNLAYGIGDAMNGEVMRGAQTAAPKAVKDVIKMARYINEGGIANRQGDLLVEDLSWLELGAQAIGFTPNRSVFRYDQNSAMKGYERAALKRRQDLMAGYWMAYRAKDAEAMRELQKVIRKFNRSTWGKANPITAKSIKQSIKRRQKNLQRSKSGVLINQKYDQLVSQYEYWQ